jgi:hypothetical protein
VLVVGLSSCSFSQDIHLIDSLVTTHYHCVVLDLTRAGLDSASLVVIANGCMTTRAKHRDTSMSSAHEGSLHSLRALSLRGNFLLDNSDARPWSCNTRGITALGGMLARNKTLEYLDLSDCLLGHAFIETHSDSFAALLERNDSLQYLDLSGM